MVDLQEELKPNPSAFQSTYQSEEFMDINEEKANMVKSEISKGPKIGFEKSNKRGSSKEERDLEPKRMKLEPISPAIITWKASCQLGDGSQPTQCLKLRKTRDGIQGEKKRRFKNLARGSHMQVQLQSNS